MKVPTSKAKSISLCLLASVLHTFPSSAATVWDEAVHGDLNSTPATPTAVSFSAGSNVVVGDVNSATDIRDYFTFTLGSAETLTAVTLVSYQGNLGFTAINSGATSFVPSVASTLNFLGGTHTGAGLVGLPLLTLLASGAQAGTGFAPPLGSGTYTYLMQQTSGELTSYALDFQVALVPAPGAVWLLGSGLIGLAGWRARWA
jgi:hypothetical protein